MKLHIQLALLACVANSSLAAPQCPPAEVFGLTAVGNQPWDYFGATVGVSGTTTLVGAAAYPSPVQGANGPGAVFVYERDPLDAHAWMQPKKIVAPPGFNTFGWTVALDGDTAAIACAAISYPWSYVVHVHERNAGGNGAWGFVAELRNDYYPFGNADHFGRGLAVRGDRIAVGAPAWGGPSTDSGSVYLFERNTAGQNNWGQVARIIRPGPPSVSPSDFGRTLSLDGDAILIGDQRSAAARLYERNAGGLGQWGLVHSFFEQAQFPYSFEEVLSVALHGDTVMLGWQFSSQTLVKWFVRVHERNLGGAANWGVRQTLMPTGGSQFTKFGNDIDFDGARALIGAPSDVGAPSRGGAVYLFEHNGSATAPWQQTARLTASDTLNNDRFGVDVELDSTAAVIGNLRNSTASSNLGKVHVFDLATPASPVSYCTAGTSSNGCTGVLIGVGTPSASANHGFDLVATNIDGQRQGALFYGVSGTAAIPIPGGANWRCVAPPRQRLGIQHGTGTPGACDGSLRADWNAFIATNPGALGAPFAAGQSVWAQGWWRDPQSPASGAATQGLLFTLCP